MTKDEPAFPGTSEFPTWQQNAGLTKREYAAIMISAGLHSHPSMNEENNKYLARWAVEGADALLKALEEGK
jgi:hypothetical protein